MSNQQSFLEFLLQRGISRRSFMKFAALTASSLALSGKEARVFADGLACTPRPRVIWLSFQQCTGCSESILRAYDFPAYQLPDLDNPGQMVTYPGSLSIETVILSKISLDYHETLQVAAGDQAEKMHHDAMQKQGYVLIVDGSIPVNGVPNDPKDPGRFGTEEFWSCAAGNSNLGSLKEAVKNAGLVIALGTCATYGGIPHANPNPSYAWGYTDVINSKHMKGVLSNGVQVTVDNPPLINLSGCPPMAEVIVGTIAYYLYLVANKLPIPGNFFDSATLRRPALYYGHSVHDTCPRHKHWVANEFATSHGDEKARKGWCLLHLGCRGPEVRNSCTRLGWNNDPADRANPNILNNSPMHTGHGCIGCSEPNFWDTGDSNRFSKGFYTIQQ